MAITKIGTPELFDFSATNTALQLPTGTTLERPTSPSAGQWRFNTDEKYVEYYDGGAWREIDTEAPIPTANENFNVNTYFGDGGTQKIDAKFNGAASFNGASSGSQIFISDADVFSPANNDLSFSVWVKTSSTSGGYFASKQDDSTVTYEWQFYMNTNGTVAIGVFTSTGTTIAVATSTATVNDGNWHNVAFVIDTNSSITVYVDKAGVTNSSWSGTMSNTSTDVLLGAGGGVPGFRLQGMLDQARFFNTALSSSQIDSLYDSETTTTAATLDFPVGAGCFAAYQLDGDASDVGGTYGGVTTDIGYTGLKFEPDFVWIKRRDGAANHVLFDSVRGVGERLHSDTNDSQASTLPNGLTSFDSNGFTVVDNSGGGTGVNGSAQEYVAWNWKAAGAAVQNNDGSIVGANCLVSANQAAGFSIVKYTGNNTVGATIGHGLGAKPELFFIKNLTASSGSRDWIAWCNEGNTTLGYLNHSDAFASSRYSWALNSTQPTITTITFGNDPSTNGSFSYVAYCFRSITGYQKVGSYTGTSGYNNFISTEITSGDGGFEPAFLMIKRTDAAGGWIMLDNKRSTSNPRTKYLTANTNDAEGDAASIDVYFLTNGFSVGGTNTDINVGTYIYLAIAADKDSTVPTQANSFSPAIYTGDGGTQNIYTPLAPDFTWIKNRTNAYSHQLYDSVRGTGSSNSIQSDNTFQQGVDANLYGFISSFNPNGFTILNPAF